MSGCRIRAGGTLIAAADRAQTLIAAADRAQTLINEAELSAMQAAEEEAKAKQLVSYIETRAEMAREHSVIS